MPPQENEDALRLKRVTYAKYLLDSARRGLRSPSPLVAAEGLLRLHDSIEIFQSVVLDKLGVPKQKYGSFMEFWDLVKKQTGADPPYRDRFRALNELRVNFKHHALLPNLQELQDLAVVVPLFFEDVCRRIVELDFRKLSLGDLIPEGEVRDRVKAGEGLAESHEREEAVAQFAVAMELLLRGKYANIPTHLHFDFNLFKHERVTYEERLRRSCGELESEAVAALEDCFQELQSQIEELRGVVEMIAWGVNLQEYTKFKFMTPHVTISTSGRLQIVWSREISLTDDDVNFCLQFVINTALNIEARRPAPPPDPFA